MKHFIDNVYLVFFSPLEFPYFWANYYSKLNENIVILFSSFAIALGICINSFELSELGIFLYLFLFNIIFLTIFLKLFTWVVNQSAKDYYGVDFNQKILISHLTYLLCIFWLLPSITIFTRFFELNSAASLNIALFLLGLIYILRIVRAVSLFYRIEEGLAFRVVFSSLYLLFVAPIFLALYYFIIFLFLTVLS